MSRNRNLKEYAVYRGEEFKAIGTMDELAEELNVERNTIFFYKSPAYRRRVANSNRAIVVVELEDDEEDVIC